MGTRSLTCVISNDGKKIHTKYTQSDGYIQEGMGVGNDLFTCYNTYEKAMRIVNIGNSSAVYKNPVINGTEMIIIGAIWNQARPNERTKTFDVSSIKEKTLTFRAPFNKGTVLNVIEVECDFDGWLQGYDYVFYKGRWWTNALTGDAMYNFLDSHKKFVQRFVEMDWTMISDKCRTMFEGE